MKKLNRFFSLLLSICLFLNACSTKLISPDRLMPEKTPKLQEYDYIQFSHKNLLERIRSFNKALTETDKKLNIENLQKLGGDLSLLLEEYKKFKSIDFNRNEGYFSIPPNSKTTYKFESYCLNPHGGSPSSNEQFILRKTSPDIPLYKEIMLYSNSKNKFNGTKKQLLLWNLKNDVKFENLPLEQQEFLLKIDPTSYLKVNNMIKSELKSQLTKYAKSNIPFYNKAEEAMNMVKGKSYTYQEYAKNVEDIVSKIKLLPDKNPIKADGYDIYTLTQSSGFSGTTITFINLTTFLHVISCSAFLDPLRDGIQPIGFDLSSIFDEHDKYKDDIEKEIDKLLALLLSKIGNSGDSKSMLDNIKDKRALLSFLGEGFMSTQYTKASFLRNGSDDESDAFRHAIWNALMVRDIGESLAEEFATNHEIFDKDQTQRQKEMDMHNNKVGRETGKELLEKGIKDDLSYIKEILKNKDLLDVIDKTGKWSWKKH